MSHAQVATYVLRLSRVPSIPLLALQVAPAVPGQLRWPQNGGRSVECECISSEQNYCAESRNQVAGRHVPFAAAAKDLQQPAEPGDDSNYAACGGPWRPFQPWSPWVNRPPLGDGRIMDSLPSSPHAGWSAVRQRHAYSARDLPVGGSRTHLGVWA